MAVKRKLKVWRVFLLRGRATYVGQVEAVDHKAAIEAALAAIEAALKEMPIPPHLRGKVSVERG